MGNGYAAQPTDTLDQLRMILQDVRRRVRELESPDWSQSFSVDAQESYGAPNLLSVTTSSTVAGVEALIGTPLVLPRGGRYFVSCTADVQTRLRGTGGTISVGVDVKDTNSAGSSIGINSGFTFGHTANDNVQLSVPVTASGIVGIDADASLVCRIVYSITPGTTDGRLEIPSVRLSVQGLKPGQS